MNRRVVWHCICDCGNYKDVVGSYLENGDTASCGCIATEKLIKRNTIHGGHGTRLYNVYRKMIDRCEHVYCSEYKNYGGRGIIICDEWKNSYEVFKNWAIAAGYDENAEHGECTIERRDVNGNYCPENCIWVTMKEQENNKRNNHFLTYDGVTKTLAQWSEELGINYGTLKSRINKLGWTTEEALEITKRLRPNFVKDIED